MRHAFSLALLRPYIFRELPGWGRLYATFIGSYEADHRWQGMPRRRVRGKLHGYDMELNLGAWSERATYFLGRYYDLRTQSLLIDVLRPGDRVLDIGANIGMVSLLASRLVGPQGRVDSIEPNPVCAARIRSFLEANSISNVHVHQIAAGEREGEATLNVPEWNTGEASLAPMPGQHGKSVRPVAVRVAPAQSIAELVQPGPIVVKIDVEGFEVPALRGLLPTLERDRPMLITEVIDDSLRRAGASTSELFALLTSLSYIPYAISMRRAGVRHAVRLSRCDEKNHPSDVAWLVAGSPAASRVTRDVLPDPIGR